MLADELDMAIRVHHLPPATSKWNKIEHRLFSAITGNWRGRPLETHQMAVELIANTTTTTGLLVRSEADTNHYETRIKGSDAEMREIRLDPDEFHPDWTYTIYPKRWE